MDIICGNCVFYRLKSNVDGVCFRYPPTAYPAPGKSPLGQPVLNSLVMRPTVSFTDFCGDFLPRQEEPKPELSPNQTGD